MQVQQATSEIVLNSLGLEISLAEANAADLSVRAFFNSHSFCLQLYVKKQNQQTTTTPLLLATSSKSRKTHGIDIVLGAQWGDEGKGKLVDLLSQNYDVCCRVAGDSNAGHTIVVNGTKYKFHLLPSGS